MTQECRPADGAALDRALAVISDAEASVRALEGWPWDSTAIEGKITERGGRQLDVEITVLKAAFVFIRSFIAAHPPAAETAPGAGDVEDARRFRWIEENPFVYIYLDQRMKMKGDLRALIDADIARQGDAP